MTLFGYNIEITKTEPSLRREASSAIADWVRGEDVGGARLVNAYGQVVWVYRAVNALAEAVANIPFRFAAEGEGRDRISAGALQEFYARPHPLLNGFQYWEMRVMWLLLRGECFRVPVFKEGKGGRRVLDRIMFLDPARFRHVVEHGQLIGWQYMSGGREDAMETQVLLPEEVWFERMPNPFDQWRGMAPLAVIGVAVANDFAAGNFMRALMENNGDAGVIVQASEPLDPDQREQIRAALRERKRGQGVADRPLLLWGGVEVVQPPVGAVTKDYLNHRRFTVSEICAAFGVPEEVVTTQNAAKYDIMTTSRLFFVENRVAPFCRRLEVEEQRVVKAIDPRAKGFFEVEEHPAMAAARRERLEMAKHGFNMGIPLNELNRALELGFKPLPWGNVGYIPANMLKVES
jgi:HK97 family phage portal protein